MRAAGSATTVEDPPRVRPSEARRWATAELRRLGVDQAAATAELALRHVLACDRSALTLRTAPLSAREAGELRTILQRRAAGEPIQHVLGTQAFRALELRVRPGVFVPRPETELLVERALTTIARTRHPFVIDVGTGTGAIALSVAAERPDATVVATDRSAGAVALASENAERLGLGVDVRLGDLLLPIAPSPVADLVVSNPPYLDPGSGRPLPVEVAADPPVALFGAPELFERLIEQAARRLIPGGSIALEVGEDQGRRVAGLLSAAFEGVRVDPDLAGRERFVTGRRR